MTDLHWSQDDILGDAKLDREHQELFALVQGLATAQPDRAAALLGDLADLSRRHFEAEEARMRETGYYGAAAHRAEHRFLLGILDARRKEGERLDPSRVATELADTLLHHIREVDRLFARFLDGRKER